MNAGAVLLPLRGLATAGREIGAMGTRRWRPAGAEQAAAALAAARDGGWALVTGASSGIGRAYAEALAARDLNVLLVADDERGLTETAAALDAAGGGKCDVLVADLADHGSIERLTAWVGERQVDVLVNNAGVGVKGAFCAADPDAYVEMVNVNLLAPTLLTRALLPAMVERRRGAVVHVASINALAPMPRSAVYSATKSFLLAYATAVWFEHRDDGVVFQTVLPGTTATAFHERQGTRLPAWAMRPEDVARESLEALGRAPVCVPGRLGRVLRGLGALLPLELRTAAAGAVMTASLGPV